MIKMVAFSFRGPKAVVNKRGDPKCELHTGDGEMQQIEIQLFEQYVVRDEERRNIENLRRIAITKNTERSNRTI